MQALANSAGVSRPTIYRLLKGESPSPETKRQMHAFYSRLESERKALNMMVGQSLHCVKQMMSLCSPTGHTKREPRFMLRHKMPSKSTAACVVGYREACGRNGDLFLASTLSREYAACVLGIKYGHIAAQNWGWLVKRVFDNTNNYPRGRQAGIRNQMMKAFCEHHEIGFDSCLFPDLSEKESFRIAIRKAWDVLLESEIHRE